MDPTHSGDTPFSMKVSEASGTRSFIVHRAPQLAEPTPISMLLSLNALKKEGQHTPMQSSTLELPTYTKESSPFTTYAISRSPDLMPSSLNPIPNLKDNTRRPTTRVARRSKKYSSLSLSPPLRPIAPAETPYSSKPTSSPGNIKKVYVQKACINCKFSHVACDTSRPCLRCIRNGKSASCIDAARKKRGRPSAKQNSSTDDSDTSIDSPTKLSPIRLLGPNDGGIPDFSLLNTPSGPNSIETIYKKSSLRAILLYPADLDKKSPYPSA
ncbi:hypothetical protein K7432_007109 [Basidiobolus ranarum]|uniref:Zn(2)-C6 fungal-type domain-containing protein n=1 Tax=Basidiobolus ranarum TaxID=34480 RepID=A0ABR2W0N0_9FUNG